ncbi:MAG TPA: ECF transporter S component [Candidatus Onthovivens sp.]|nr:ECF transporter S component [Candidatus Onthovivens sp.]
MKNKKLIKNITIDAIFLAIFILFTFVPYLGFYQIGIISFTIIHVFVLIGAMVFGVKKATLFGFFFGILSLLKAIMYPGTLDFLFINPFISVLPRVLFGFLSGLLFDYLRKIPNKKTYYGLCVAGAALMTLVHTTLTLTCLFVFGILDVFQMASLLGLEALINEFKNSPEYALAFFGGIISPGAGIEIAVAAITVPSITLALEKANVNKDI